MRLMLVWAMATILPKPIDSMASMVSISPQVSCKPIMPSTNKRISMAKAAILGTEAISRVIAVGEP